MRLAWLAAAGFTAGIAIDLLVISAWRWLSRHPRGRP